MSDIKVTTDSGKFIAGARTDSGDHVGDLYVYHNGTNSFVENETGILYVTNKADANMVLGTDNSARLTIESDGTIVTSGAFQPGGNVTAGGNLALSATNTLFFDGNGGHTFITEFAANKMQLQAGGQGSVIFDGTNSGEIRTGIGTSSPNTALHLKFTDNTTNATDNSSLTHSSGIYINNESTTNEAHSSVGFRTNNLDGSLSMIYGGSANEGRMSVNMEGAERLSVTHDGKVFIGSTSSRALSGVNAQLQVEGTDYGTSSLHLIGNTGTDAGTAPILFFGRSRGTSDGSSTVVANDDRIGALFFCAADGTDISTPAATIQVSVDGTPGGNDMPGRIEFRTTADGSSSTTERMRITSGGNVGINETSPDHKLHIKLTGDADFDQSTDLNGESILYLEGANNDGEATMIRWANHGSMNNYFGCVQVGGSSQADFVWTAYNGSNYSEKFRVRANGNIIAKQLNQTGSTSNRYPLYWVHTGTDGSIEPYTGSVRAMKKDIADMGSVNWIHSLTPRSFKFRDFEDVDGVRTYKNTTKDNPTTEYGLIAEEVSEVEGSEYIVDKDSDGKVKGVLYHNLVPILLKAVQELSAEVEKLKNA